MNQFVKYFHLWSKLTINSFLSTITSRFSTFLFLLGKSLRFIFFVIFLIALFTKASVVANYTLMQGLFFFLTFNFIDTTTQLFFREVYRFRELVVSGDFDLVLTKPMSALFRALAGGADVLDLIMLVPYVGALVYVGSHVGGATMVNIVLYVLLLMNGFLIATAFHILVLALAIMTTEVDHAVMIYRDITSMGRFPVDIYKEPLRSFITFAIPVGVMMTFPAKAFLGFLSPNMIAVSLILGLVFFFICIRIWRFALTQYASASS